MQSSAELPSVVEWRQSRRRRSFGQSMCWDASLSEELVEQIWRDPDGLLAEGSSLQFKPRCSVARIAGHGGEFVWKRHNWGGISRTLRKSLSRSVGKKCWTDGRFLCEAGVPTPRPRLYLERRFGPLSIRSYLLTDYVEGTSLYRFMRFEQPAESEVQQLARQAAAIWQQLDDLRIQHNDFQTENVLVDPQRKLWLIDLERLRRYRRRENMRRKQIRDLHDLLHARNWRANPEAGELFRREILRTPAAIEALADHRHDAHPLSRPVHAMNRREHLVTVLVPCLNAAATIQSCLKSVRDMADEILVADAGSADETVSLARRFGGCRIIQRQAGDAAAFESWACQQARHSWILRVLPNEQVNSELGREVQELLASEPQHDAYRISRLRYFRGRPLSHGGFERDASPRLFRKDAVQFEIRDGRVEVISRADPVGPLRCPLAHETCCDLRLYLAEMMRAAAHAAETDESQGHRPHLRAVYAQAPWQLFKSFVLRGGWLDGWAGLHASVLSAFAIYLRETMLWERQQPALHSVANAIGQELKVFPGAVGPDQSSVSFPTILTVDGGPHSDSDERRMRSAA